MSKPILTASLTAPAFMGLNTQESSVANNPQFALQANNCVIDKFGRLGARKGWQLKTSSGGTGVALKGMHPFLDIAGVNTQVSWSATKFYSGLSTLTERTPTTSDTIIAGNWQACTLNDRSYYFQAGYKPLYYTNESGSLIFKSIDQHADYTGSAPLASIGVSMMGRLWAADTAANKTTVYFSNLLNGAQWDTGTSGTLNIASVLPKGTDVITGLGESNGNLIIFCKNHIIIYSDGDSAEESFDVANLNLVEVIPGVGCIAKDSIQNIGGDIVFLSSTGLRSLGRTIQEKSLPMSDISKNVRDTFMTVVNDESNLGLIKSCYFPEEAIYLISLPEAKTAFVFDTRQQLDDMTLRVTTWNNQTHTDFIYDATDRAMYLTQTNGLAKYKGYSDNSVAYTMSYYTNHFDLERPNILKILKRASVTAIGSTGQSFTLKVGFDYTTSYVSFPFKLKETKVSEFGIADFGSNATVVAEFNLGVSLDRVDQSIAGSGSIVQIGIETKIDGAQLSVQKLDIYTKQGRII